MADLKMILDNTNRLYSKIDSILRLSTYDECDDLSGLEIDYQDGEQLFLLDELRAIMKNLDEVKGRLAYLALPIHEVSRLHKNGSGRYETESGHYYTYGSSIEALVKDSFSEMPRWIRTSVEGNGKGYFMVGYDKVEMDGLTVRVRGEG